MLNGTLPRVEVVLWKMQVGVWACECVGVGGFLTPMQKMEIRRHGRVLGTVVSPIFLHYHVEST